MTPVEAMNEVLRAVERETGIWASPFGGWSGEFMTIARLSCTTAKSK